MFSTFILYFLIGAGFAVWHNLPVDYPPPFRYFAIVIAGGVGGVVGALLVNNLDAASNPLPGYLAAAAAGMIVSSAVTMLRAGQPNTGR